MRCHDNPVLLNMCCKALVLLAAVALSSCGASSGLEAGLSSGGDDIATPDVEGMQSGTAAASVSQLYLHYDNEVDVAFFGAKHEHH